MQKSNSPKGTNNEPLWFDENDTTITTINVGGNSPHKIMLCTPCHSDVSMHYCQAVLEFQQECWQKKISVSFTLLKSSLVTQGRNLCVAEMLNHEDKYTHLLFIDSDIDFQAKTIFKMLEADKDIIGCPYPMKMFSWDKSWRRLNEKKDAIKNQEDYVRSAYTYPVKLKDPNNVESKDGIIEMTHAPTGCFLVKREVLEKMMKEYPELEIFQPTIINGKEEKKPNMFNLFDTLHDLKTKRYFGEDFGFCQRWRDIGGKVYGYINDDITHVGEHSYTGRFYDDLWQGSRPLKSVDDTKKIK